MARRTALTACTALGALALFSFPASAQIAATTRTDGSRLFINAEPPVSAKLTAVSSRARTTIYMPGESSFTGHGRPSVSVDKDGVAKLVREAAERHHVDAALVRAVIETESNWNPVAVSRKGAGGLMQLIPTTAQRFGVNDVFNPGQNIEAGTRYLKALLQRYNGNLDLALAAYNAGEGAVDRAGGIPAYRETRNYVQRVQNAYFRPGSGRDPDAFVNRNAIRKSVTDEGRVVYTND